MSRKRSRLDERLVHSQTVTSSCKRCRSRKIKCDDGFPRCDGCAKADVLCIVVDQSTTRDHTRAEVQSLEDELSQLQALLMSITPAENGAHSAAVNEHSQQNQDTACATRPDDDNQFILSGANITRRQRPMPSRPRNYFKGFHKPHALPPYDYAVQAVSEYFREFNVRHPLLDQDEVTVVLRAVYDDTGGVCMPEKPFSQAQKRDLFQLNMALAIGSIKPFHEGVGILHPFGFFTAALEVSPPSEFHFNEASDVGNLLLIAHFGLFYNIGCSIWELGRLCVRICIELQLHRRQGMSFPAPMVAHQCRLVFWESYLLDRFSSSILGRPFAVEDEAIDVEVPGSSFGKAFDHLLHIGRITSQMHISILHPTFRNKNPYTGSTPDKTPDIAEFPGSMNALSHLRRFHSHLQRWKLETPTYELPRCVYETTEFFEMTFQESRLCLFRAVLHELPEDQLEIKLRLSHLCHQAAQNILACFSSIKDTNLLAHDRSMARLILISGLMIISSIKMQSLHGSKQNEVQSHSDIDVNFWLKDIALDSAGDLQDPITCSRALESCAKNLSCFASSIPEVSAYAQLFERLRSEAETILRLHPARQREMISQTLLLEDGSIAAVAAAEASQHHQNDWSHSFTRADGTLHDLDPSMFAQFTTTSTNPGPVMLEQTLGADTTRNLGGEVIEGESLWSFPNGPWMEGIDGDISGMIWDTAVPWQWSPFTNM
ncbi:hypothetical protein BKA63DRAFT_598553 [Paraphoma chrysanthemicola]|nr:hypothetical protein BKA63DRAFT_598553 [Paraphoma chrysanthemicola]